MPVLSKLYKNFRVLPLGLVVLLGLLAGPAAPAAAQALGEPLTPARTEPTATSGALPHALILSPGRQRFDLGPYAYMTSSEDGPVTYAALIAGHLAGNHRGQSEDYNVLPLGSRGVPHWVLFAVRNANPDNARWVFSFGSHASGRYGTFSRAFIYDHLSKNYLLYAMPDSNGNRPSPESLPLTGNGFSFILPPGRQVLLALYIVPEPGGLVTIAPQIMTEQAYWKQQHSPVYPDVWLPGFFVVLIGYALGHGLLRRDPASAALALYIGAQTVLYCFQDKTVYAEGMLASEATYLIVSAVALSGLALTKFFLGLRGDQARQSFILYGMALATLILPAVVTLTFPETNLLRMAVLLFIPWAGFLLMALLSSAQAMIGKPAAGLFAATWGILTLGALLSGLSMTGVLPSDVTMVNAYWFAACVQVLFLAAAVTYRVRAEEERDEQSVEIGAEDADLVGRMREARDSSENARLLKVIEHERAILQDLRDRELQQNEEMRQARDGADMANRAKSAFLAVISHEIRTPMTGIMGMVRLLLDTTLSKEQKDYARTIQDSGDAMLSLLNDILDFEKIESGKMELETVDFDLLRLVNDIITLMSGHASHKKIELRADIGEGIPRFVRGDPVRLRQVLLNLTGNAIKFTGEGSVVVTLRQTAREGLGDGLNKIYFGVRDSGIGISKEAQKNLFNPFSQADNSISRKYGGSGLGLVICQRLIEAMGGKIEIDSVEGEGSTFFFAIPMETGEAERVEIVESASLSSQSKPAKVLNILCVDDNEINQKLLKEFVSRLGHQPVLAGSGEQALELIRAQPFDMVLMDVELPGISGMGATRAIRAMPEKDLAALPVIALTGNVCDEDIRQCYAANMNGHLAKPIEPDKLKAQIDKVIKKRLDNPVLLDESRTDSVSSQQVVIAEVSPAETRALSFEEDDLAGPGAGRGMASIRAFALQADAPAVPEKTIMFSEQELDEDSFASALAGNEKAVSQNTEAQMPESVFDHAVLDGLKGGMKRGDLQEMIGSLTDKNDEIVMALQEAIQTGDLGVIGARAHEMKGMSGNFGLKELAAIAAKIEKAAKDNVPDGLPELIALLPEANARSKDALNHWLAS